MRPSAIRSLFDDEALCKFCHASLTDSRPTQAEQLKRSIFGVYRRGLQKPLARYQCAAELRHCCSAFSPVEYSN